jgi:preprotein translocase subunit SecB
MTAPKEAERDALAELEYLRLVRCRFDASSTIIGHPEEPIEVDFEFQVRRVFPKPNVLVVGAGITIFKDQEHKPFTVDIEYEARFTVPEGSPVDVLSRFARYNAPAILFPFLREMVANVTGRTPFTPLVLPPLNVKAIIDALEKRDNEGETQEQSPATESQS